MDILATAAGEAKETIGKGLVDALSLLAGDGNTIQPLADSMADLSQYIADVTVGTAKMIAALKNIPGVGAASGASDNVVVKGFKQWLRSLNPLAAGKDFLDFLANEGSTTAGMGGYPSSALGGVFIDPNEAARKKAEEEAAKRAKELAALQAKALRAQTKANALLKASKTLDLDRIGMTAALRGKISETDRLSLNLQLALLDKNEQAATKLSDQLTEAVKRQNLLNAALIATPEAPNPYRNWQVPKDLISYTAASLGVSAGSLGSGPVAPSATFSDAQMELMSAINSFQKADAQAINIEVYLDGDAVGGAVRESSINASLSGSFNTVNRYGRFGLSGTQ
jgi:hypothetical protein